jgi:hypothetical protein
MAEYNIRMVDAEATIMQEIADPDVSLNSIGLTYGFLIKESRTDWLKVNSAIINRFGAQGLIKVKRIGWSKNGRNTPPQREEKRAR